MGFILGFLFRSLIGLLFTILGAIMAIILKFVGFLVGQAYKGIKKVCDPTVSTNASYVKRRNAKFVQLANKENVYNKVIENYKADEMPIARRTTRIC